MGTVSTRKIVKQILASHGLDNKFTTKLADFTDLARGRAHFVTIQDWNPNPIADVIKSEIKEQTGSITIFQGKGMVG